MYEELFKIKKPIEYVYDAVNEAMYDLSIHERYTLCDLVELGTPGLWSILFRYSDVHQLGKEFFYAVNRGKFPGLRACGKTSARNRIYRFED